MDFALWRKGEMEKRGLSMGDLYPELKVQQPPELVESSGDTGGEA
jgi:hypothetical protein